MPQMERAVREAGGAEAGDGADVPSSCELPRRTLPTVPCTCAVTTLVHWGRISSRLGQTPRETPTQTVRPGPQCSHLGNGPHTPASTVRL